MPIKNFYCKTNLKFTQKAKKLQIKIPINYINFWKQENIYKYIMNSKYFVLSSDFCKFVNEFIKIDLHIFMFHM